VSNDEGIPRCADPTALLPRPAAPLSFGSPDASIGDQPLCTGENVMTRFAVSLAVILLLASTGPTAAQQTRAGLLTCDVSAGLGLILGSQKELSCAFAPEGAGRREEYDGTITKFGLDVGIIGGGVMMWAVSTRTAAGPGALAGDYVGVSGEASVGTGLGANILVGGSNRSVTLQPLSVQGQIGLNFAVGVAALHLGLPIRP
jgi:hypothetical protein